MLATLLLASCSAQPTAHSTFVCEPTIAHMTPPSEALEFFAGGSSQPDQARESLRQANWLGNAAMWIVLPRDGEIVARRDPTNGRTYLDDKIPPYRMKSGYVTYTARQLDGSAVVARTAIGPSGYGDLGFQAGGPSFPTRGCWEVTYELNEKDPLRFVVRVR